MSHPIPDDVLIDHLAVLAKTGAGKTYLAKGIVERLLEKKRRVCIVDPKNAWWGLKSSADGKSPAFSIIIFGGPNADVPLLTEHGKVLGEAVATSDMSCIICTKGMPESQRIRFLTDFFQTLDMKNTEPLHLVLDEAHMMAPQKPLGEMQRLTHWTSELVSGGRGMGFRIILLSQRPARLNKDVLTQCESLVAMRMTGPQDRDAVKNWIHDQADMDKGKEIVASLPSLPNGTGWFWAPAQGILKQVKFPLITTYDNSKTTRDSKTDAKASLAPVDLTKLQERLGKVKAEIEANDPAALKRQVAELRKQVAQKPSATPSMSEADQARLRSEGWNAGWAGAVKEANAKIVKQQRAFKAIGTALDKARGEIPIFEEIIVAPPTAPAPAIVIKAGRRPSVQSAPTGDLTRPQQRVIDAVAWWAAAGNDSPTRAQIAGVAGYSPGSGGFNNLVGGLGTSGLLEVPSPGTLRLTDNGRAAANDPGIPSTNELHDRVRGILSNPQIKLFDVLTQEFPEAITRDELAKRAGYSAGSGGFNNLLGKMSTLEIVTKPAPGTVRASDWLFLS